MLPFFTPHALAAATIAAYLLNRPEAFALPVWAFLVGLVVDLFLAARNHGTLAPYVRRRHWQLLLFLWVPLHAGAVLCGLHAATQLPADPTMFWPRTMAIVIGVGMVGGTLGGAIAHEFLHAPRGTHRVVGVGLMSLLTYGHFSIIHVAGHHRLVGTASDPATARRGESIYAFLFRSFAEGGRLAWRAERRRLHRRRQPVWSTRNRLLQIVVWQAGLYAAIYAVFDATGVIVFAMQGFVGSVLIETMNYVMHYGLERGSPPAGRVAPVNMLCSWNTRRLATTYMMCGIGLHSYHHCRSSKPFHRLTLPATAPELPGGLFAMFVLAWFPPLWRSVMDPLADFWMSLTRAGSVSDTKTEQWPA